MTAASFKKLFSAALKIGTLLGLVLCLFFLAGFFERIELVALDARYRIRGQPVPSQDIVIIGITQRCLNQLGKFPWPRTYHADLINFLKTAGAKVVAVDIFFSQPDIDPAIDQSLSEAIKNSRDVILPVFMPYRITKFTTGDNFIEVEDLIESIPDFTKGALSQGHINVIPDSDGTYRKAALAIKHYDRQFFCLGLEAAIKFLGISPSEIRWEPENLRLKDKKIPLEGSKFMYINFCDVETKSRRYAFSDVVKGLVPPENFKNKLVFIGQTTQGLPNADILQTPFREKYGVTLQANIANTILSDFYIKRVEAYKTCLWVFLICMATCLTMILIKTWGSTLLVLAGFIALCFMSIRSFTLKGAILDFAPLASSIIAAFTGSILYRIRHADRLVKTKELELDSILQAGMIAAGGLKTDKASDLILSTVINSIGAKGLLLRWKNKKTGVYEKQYLYGTAASFLKSPLADAEEKLAEHVVKARKASFVKDTRSDAIFGSKGVAQEPHSIMCAPLIVSSEVMGTLTLFDKMVTGQPQQIAFDEEDLKLFLILTQQTAISLENAILFEEVNELFLNSIKSLAETIDAKDPYTHGHSERVTANVLAIVDEMQIPEDQKKDIMVGAILHDIGKVGIKDAILSKPAQLTAEEKIIFDQHSEIGSKIMSPIKQLEDIIPLIRHHHENYDGTGYPDGLKAGHIPLGARIISVADTFDAMTSNRPYRKALSEETAKQEISKLAAKQFDPQVVEAFNKAHAKGRIRKA